MMNRKHQYLTVLLIICLLLTPFTFFAPVQQVTASPFSDTLAYAILADDSVLRSSSYTDRDPHGNDMVALIEGDFGTMHPREGNDFILLSTGKAGASIITTNEYNPGVERGTYYNGGGNQPWDRATLTMELEVPLYMHFLCYDVQFFTSEYPDYSTAWCSSFNDVFTVTVDRDGQPDSSESIDVFSGDFVLTSYDLVGTGFDIFAHDSDGAGDCWTPGVDIVSTDPQGGFLDAGATALVTKEHPVSPGEIIEITFDITDIGDNQFDSAAYIDNLCFSGFARTNISGTKTAEDIDGGELLCGDEIHYKVTISNKNGGADQPDNDEDEFVDILNENTTFVPGSLSAIIGGSGAEPWGDDQWGTIEYVNDQGVEKIIWNGGIPDGTTVRLDFNVTVKDGLFDNSKVDNQGIIYWDSNENESNGDIAYTDTTVLYVSSDEIPTVVIEDFDDITGGPATEIENDHLWFSTGQVSVIGDFNVVSSYHYQTSKAFATKLRRVDGNYTWEYFLDLLYSDVKWWDVWFACGNTSEPADLLMDFQTEDNETIVLLNISYVEIAGHDEDALQPYAPTVSYQKADQSWEPVETDHEQNYLYNNWYHLNLSVVDASTINISLQGKEQTQYSSNAVSLGLSLAQCRKVVWSSSYNPGVCPMIFWDEHRLGLLHE